MADFGRLLTATAQLNRCIFTAEVAGNMFNFNQNNIFNNLSQFSNFKKNLLQSGTDPAELLAQEIKKRGITQEQLRQLTELAQSLKNIIK